MLVEAMEAELKIDRNKANVVLGRRAKPETWMPDYVEPNPLGDKHESLRGAWWLLEFLPHRYVTRESGSHIARYRIPMGSNRAIPELGCPRRRCRCCLWAPLGLRGVTFLSASNMPGASRL
jgi:hypothetical protein